jgi:hypothetical protein
MDPEERQRMVEALLGAGANWLEEDEEEFL